MPDRIESELRRYYEAEAEAGLRPAPAEWRQRLCERFASDVGSAGCSVVLDIGSGPGTDHAPFEAVGVGYVGVDLAVGNGRVAVDRRFAVVPGSLFELPFATGSFRAGWSMSALQHVPDDRIDDALVEMARVFEPGAPLMIGLWGGRDEVIESDSAWSEVALPRHFTLRSHERIQTILSRHLRVESYESFPAGWVDWEYHVARVFTFK